MHVLASATLTSLLALGAPDAAADRDRAKIPDEYKWNLADLYPSDAAWQAARARLEAEIPSIEPFAGKLADPAQLRACLELDSRLSKDFSRLYAYASMMSDQDTRESKYLAMEQELRQLGTVLRAKESYIEPELLKLDRAKIDAALAAEKGLAVYRHYLDNVARRKAHTLGEGEERIIAHASLMAGGADTIYNIFANADFPYPEVTLKNGSKVTVDQAAYTLYRAAADRDDRRQVFAAFFGRLNDYRRTFGAALDAQVKNDMFYMRARNYKSCLESALDDDNIPVDVYRSLVAQVNANLKTFHRYLALRKKVLGVDQLHYYDLYAPLVADVDLRYPVEDGRKLVLQAVQPLGSDYGAVIERAFRERWFDMYPAAGKKSGAYSNGAAYDVHPYMLLNYNGQYEDLSTLAHELGHTMHSYLANKTQPWPTASYSIFVAEVASTFNEALLVEHLLKTVTDPRVRLALLGSYLEGIKGTVFRQTQFAEFELAIHDIAEKGEALTGDRLNQVYRDITRRYYGHDQKVCLVDDSIDAEWAYIPHFYSPFYVYQYATSFTASSALSEQVAAGDAAATRRYLDFLGSGGADYPIELLRKAGVDMTTSAPFDLTMKRMNRVMDEFEKLLAELRPGQGGGAAAAGAAAK